MPEETAEKQPSFDETFDEAVSAEPEVKEEVAEAEGDTDGQAEKPQSESTEKAAGQTEETAEETHFLDFEERKKLTPEQQKAYKELLRPYTQKTQDLAAKRKEAESLLEFKPLIDAFKSNPEETLKQLMRQYNVQPEAAKQETKPEAQAEAQSKLQSKLRSLLGEDHQDFADRLAADIEESIQERAEAIAESKLEPIKTQQQQREERELASRVESEVKAFESRHPDYKQFEPKMVELQQKILPSENMKIGDYLDLIYSVASMGKTKAETTTEVVEKIKKMVDNAEPQDQRVSDQVVSKVAPVFKGLDDAFDKASAAAAKGELWEQR